MSKLPKGTFALSVVFFVLLSAAADARKPVALRKAGVYCIILPYAFDLEKKEIPALELPDNALLLLEGVGGECDPSIISVEQKGEVLPAAGWESFYLWGAFRVVYFPQKFDKFSGFDLRFAYRGKGGEVHVGGRDLRRLAKGAPKRGKERWKDPVTRRAVEGADPLELAELMSRGRYVEYANLALEMVRDGGLRLLRRNARSAFLAGDHVKAACLASLAIKWAPVYETGEVARAHLFWDWVLLARAFRRMKRPVAAVEAYDEALKIFRDSRIASERRKTVEESESKAGPNGRFRPGLTEMELAAGGIGSIPIPEEQVERINAGVSANGVYLGNHVERVLAQCGAPDERLSTALLYTGHEFCPEAVFISPRNLVYSIRTARGRTQEGIGAGVDLEEVKQKLGKPTETEPVPDSSGVEAGTRWVYAGRRTAFLDLDGDGKVDRIEVFDYSLLR